MDGAAAVKQRKFPPATHLTYAEAKAVWKAAWSTANLWTVCGGGTRIGQNAAGQGCKRIPRSNRGETELGNEPGRAQAPQQAHACEQAHRHAANPLTASVRGSRSALSVRKAALPASTKLK